MTRREDTAHGDQRPGAEALQAPGGGGEGEGEGDDPEQRPEGGAAASGRAGARRAFPGRAAPRTLRGARGLSTAIVRRAVALFCALMHERSSVAELADPSASELNRYSVGGKLPSSRALVERFRVSPVTVSRALAQLAAEGLVVTRPGAGAFRAPARVPSGARARGHLLAGGRAQRGRRRRGRPALRGRLRRARHAGRAAARGDRVQRRLSAPLAPARAGHGRRPGPGRAAARRLGPAARGGAARAARLVRPRRSAAPVAAADVLVTAGGQSALTTALRALAPPGAAVLVESPTYPGHAGHRPRRRAAPRAGPGGRRRGPPGAARRRVPSDRRPGLRLPAAVPEPDRRGARPRAAGRGAADRRAAAGAFVVEDDFARAPGPRGRRAAARDRWPPRTPTGWWCTSGSLTKATSPSLRVGALAARGPVLERLRAIQVVDSFFVPRPLQEAALELVGAPAWPRHLRTVAAGAAPPPGHDDSRAPCGGELPELALPHVPVRRLPPLGCGCPTATDEAALVAGGPARRGRGRARPPVLLRRTARPPVRLSFAGVAGPRGTGGSGPEAEGGPGGGARGRAGGARPRYPERP